MASPLSPVTVHVTTAGGRVAAVPPGGRLVFGRGPDVDLVVPAGRGLASGLEVVEKVDRSGSQQDREGGLDPRKRAALWPQVRPFFLERWRWLLHPGVSLPVAVTTLSDPVSAPEFP